MNIQEMRKEYSAAMLDVSDVLADPISQFQHWFQEAVDAKTLEPNAMVLSTIKADGCPSARVVLLKGIELAGFVFFTNYNSGKGRQLDRNPLASLVFNWLELQRQVRIEGRVQKISATDSTAYFQRRPKSSQIGAWASPQSQIIADRSVIEQNVKALEKKYVSDEVLPRPDHWGGFLVVPTLVEFWQGRRSRLHDRIRYLKEDDSWKIERLAQ